MAFIEVNKANLLDAENPTLKHTGNLFRKNLQLKDAC